MPLATTERSSKNRFKISPAIFLTCRQQPAPRSVNQQIANCLQVMIHPDGRN